MAFINDRLEIQDVVQIAEMVWVRVNSRAEFRLGRTNLKPETPTNIVQVAADELYERSGLGVMELPIRRIIEYIQLNEKRLDAELGRLQFGYKPLIIIP